MEKISAHQSATVANDFSDSSDTHSAYVLAQGQYWQNDIDQPSTRYVLLLAFVINALNISNRQVHDIKLVGLTDVKHLLEVHIQGKGQVQTLLIECKEFDASFHQVEMSVLIDFSDAVSRIKPDEAIVISSVGFSIEARHYAMQQGIHLADQKACPAQLENAYKNVDNPDASAVASAYRLHNLYRVQTTEPTVALKIVNPRDIDKLRLDMQQAGLSGFGNWKGEPVFLCRQEGRMQLNEFIELHVSQYKFDRLGPTISEIFLTDATIEVAASGRVPVDSILIKFEVLRELAYYEAIALELVELMMEGVDSNGVRVFESANAGMPLAKQAYSLD